MGVIGRQAQGRGPANPGATARDSHHASRQFARRRLEGQLVQFQGPVLDTEGLLRSQADKPVHRLGPVDDIDGPVIQLVADVRGIGVRSGVDHAEARYQDYPRIGIRHLVAGCGIGSEVLLVIGNEPIHAIAKAFDQGLDVLALVWMPVDKQGQPLGVNEMIGTSRTNLRGRLDARLGQKRQHLRTVVPLEDGGPPRGHQTPDHRQHACPNPGR